MKLYRLPSRLVALAFDIDNTLYENAAYAEMQQRVLLEALAEGLEIPPEEARRRVDAYRQDYARSHEGRRPSLANASAALGFDNSVSVRWRLDRIVPEDFLGEDPTLRRVLGDLAGRVRLAALTNNPEEIGRRTLRTLGVEEFFPVIIGLDTSGASKPSLLPFQLLGDTLRSPLSEVLMVGDRYGVDLAPALELGAGAVLVQSIDDTYALCELLACCRDGIV